MDFETLTGPEKAAVVILTLPEETAREFLSQLRDDEVEQILAAVSRLDEVPTKLQEKVLEEFQSFFGAKERSLAGGRAKALELISSLDEGRSEMILEKLGQDERRIDWTLRAFETPFVADVLQDEHPQTVALVLAQLPADRGAQVIEVLPEEMRPEVVIRLASLQEVTNDVIAGLEDGVASLFGHRLASSVRVGGRDAAAQVLNRISKGDGDAILEGLDDRDPDVASQVRRRMLTFNDLVAIDNRGFQVLLREVATEDLVVALKAADDEMKEKVFGNISSRAAEQIREELELAAPRKLSEVEAVQDQIVEIARRLADEGGIQLEVGESNDVLV